MCPRSSISGLQQIVEPLSLDTLRDNQTALMEMGFSPDHIVEALQVAPYDSNFDPNDFLNSVAVWMVDNPESAGTRAPPDAGTSSQPATSTSQSNDWMIVEPPDMASESDRDTSSDDSIDGDRAAGDRGEDFVAFEDLFADPGISLPPPTFDRGSITDAEIDEVISNLPNLPIIEHPDIMEIIDALPVHGLRIPLQMEELIENLPNQPISREPRSGDIIQSLQNQANGFPPNLGMNLLNEIDLLDLHEDINNYLPSNLFRENSTLSEMELQC